MKINTYSLIIIVIIILVIIIFNLYISQITTITEGITQPNTYKIIDINISDNNIKPFFVTDNTDLKKDSNIILYKNKGVKKEKWYINNWIGDSINPIYGITNTNGNGLIDNKLGYGIWCLPTINNNNNDKLDKLDTSELSSNTKTLSLLYYKSILDHNKEKGSGGAKITRLTRFGKLTVELVS
jgi:hypothetical protein